MRAINLAQEQSAGRSAGERLPTRDPARPAPRTGGELTVTEVLERLSREVGPDQLERYFGGQTRLAVRDDRLEVVVASGYLAQLLERRFGEPLKRAAQSRGRTLDVQFRVDRAAFGGEEAPASPVRAGVAPPRPPAPPVPAGKYRFESFVVGRSNRLACSACQRVAEDDAPVPMVFIHGTCGLGKTHLLRACAARFAEKRPGAAVRVTTAEAFTNEYIQAVRSGGLDGFRRSCRRVDLLCLDDVHFFANKEATQAELLHTLDAVGIDGARVLLASDEHPKEIGRLSERLVSRFLAGAVIKLDPPEPELRLRLVRHLALSRGLTLDDEAASLLAERGGAAASGGAFGGNVRELEGLLHQVEAVHRLLPEAGGAATGLTGSIVRRALGLDGKGTPTGAPALRLRRPVSAETVVAEVCRELTVDLSDFMGKGRHKRVVLARSLVASLSRRLTTMSFPEIARAMGRSNHSTVITAQRRIDRQLADDLGRPLNAETAGPHAGRSLRELADLLTAKIQRG
jgi:chromosomal replication initiator protein